jgi:hypothetical protein
MPPAAGSCSPASPEFAVSCGAVWEGDELVTHNLLAFEHNVRHSVDGFLEDSD